MKRGDVVRIKSPETVRGLRAAIVRRSKRTGGLTVELIDGRDAYKIGDTLNVAPYEVEPLIIVRS